MEVGRERERRVVSSEPTDHVVLARFLQVALERTKKTYLWTRLTRNEWMYGWMDGWIASRGV